MHYHIQRALLSLDLYVPQHLTIISRNLFQISPTSLIKCQISHRPQYLSLMSYQPANFDIYTAAELNPFSAKAVLIDFTLSNARRFYSSKGNPLAVKGLSGAEKPVNRIFSLRNGIARGRVRTTTTTTAHKHGGLTPANQAMQD